MKAVSEIVLGGRKPLESLVGQFLRFLVLWGIIDNKKNFESKVFQQIFHHSNKTVITPVQKQRIGHSCIFVLAHKRRRSRLYLS